jgi:hypothetical protein
MSAPDHRHDLETALIKIGGVADVLFSLGHLNADDHLVTTAAYLSNVLKDHQEAAYRAFCKIYRLEEGGAK